MDTKAIKIGAAVVLLAAAAGLTYYNLRSDKVLGDTVSYVCVSTGKVYQIPRGGPPRVAPLENPETRQRTLLPCQKRDDGFYISDRQRSALKELGDQNKVVDVQTLRVNVANP